MKTINLKKYYYPLYETDTFIELPDEIADAIAEEWRTDHNSEQRLWSHTYSMDYSPGLEYHCSLMPSPLRTLCWKKKHAGNKKKPMN